MLERTYSIRPLVLDYLLKQDIELVSHLAKILGHTRRTIYQAMLDLAHSFAADDSETFRLNLLVRELPNRLVNMFLKDLQYQQPRDGLNSFDVVLFGAGIVSSRFEHYRDLSVDYEVGIATRELSTSGVGWPGGQLSREGTELPPMFALVRSALDEEIATFPRIRDIRHALKLRSDPKVKAFREKLRSLQDEIAEGNVDEIMHVADAVGKASEGLKSKSALTRALKWTTYAALPVTVAETLLLGAPLLSGTLAVASTATSAAEGWFAAKHDWILFGR